MRPASAAWGGGLVDEWINGLMDGGNWILDAGCSILDDGGGAGRRQMKRTHGDEIPEALRRKLAPRDRGRTKGWGHTHAPTNDQLADGGRQWLRNQQDAPPGRHSVRRRVRRRA